MKIVMSEMKNVLNVINSRIDTAEEKVSECEYIEIKTIQNETQKEKNDKI